MITKGEALKGVVDFVSETFEKNGFKWNVKEQFFLKATPLGLLVFDLHLNFKDFVKLEEEKG